MRTLEVFSYKEMSGEHIVTDTGDYIYKPVIHPCGPWADQCHVAFVEIDPGKQSFGYHYHEMDEEVFYIISGIGAVRTPQGEIIVNAGDCITFPAGPEGAHSIRNPSDSEKLIYIDFDTHNLPEITYSPDNGRMSVAGPRASISFNISDGKENKTPRLKKGVRE